MNKIVLPEIVKEKRGFKEPGDAPPDSATDSIASVLSFFVGMIRAATACTDAAIFEYRRLPGKPLQTGRTISAPQSEASEALIAAIAKEPRSQQGTSDCFMLGRNQRSPSSYVMGLRLCAGEEVFAGGYVCFNLEPSRQDRDIVRNICLLGAGLISLLRKNAGRREAETKALSFRAQMLEALQLGADAYWVADCTGCIRQVMLLPAATDPDLIHMLEGKSIFANGGLEDKTHRHFRNLMMELRKSGGATSAIKLSGRILDDGSWHGIARITADTQQASVNVQQARTIIEQLETARDREAGLRQEAELILDGLRILTSGRSSRELFQTLLSFLAPALEFHGAVILKRDWSGKVAAVAATGPDLTDQDWQDAGQRLFALPEVAVVLRVPDDLEIAALPGNRNSFGAALAVKLKGGSQEAVLLCLHARTGFFGARHLGLGTRLSLVASQAFVNEEERQKVVDAAKLATIGEMAAGIVHEINQPLTSMTLAINNLTEALESGTPPTQEKLLDKLTKLQGQVARVSKIVANMRVLSRRSDGIEGAFAVDASINEAVEIIQHKLAKAQIEIDFKRSNLHATGNALEFSQVILNLLTNAHDAILTNSKPDEGKGRRIIVTADAVEQPMLEIRVRDTGTGFPEQAPERAFEPFFTTKDAGKGTGLGLSLCRRIVENMGGTIAVGNWAEGAEICVRLTRAE